MQYKKIDLVLQENQLFEHSFLLFSFRQFSWLLLNNLLHLTSLVRASVSVTNGIFAVVSLKPTPTLVFCRFNFRKGADSKRANTLQIAC
jgi:hypothetical protein